MPLRYYQDDAIGAAEEAFGRGVKRVLLVAATGLGKTRTFNEIIRRSLVRGERVLLLAHREELIRQSAVRLYLDSGFVAAVEMAKHAEGTVDGAARVAAKGCQASILGGFAPSSAVHEWLDDEGHEVEGMVEVSTDDRGRPRAVVASVQSLCRRLDQHDCDAFDLIVIDEAHHAVAATYKAITDHFSTSRVLGVTATPTRGDKAALEKAFDECPWQMSLPEGIEQGWLAPVRVRSVETSIDLSKVRSVAGDLNQKQLAEVLSDLGALHEIAAPIVEEAGDRQGLVFAVTVAHAHLLADVILEHVRDRAKRLDMPPPSDKAVISLDGTASDEERLGARLAFKRGECQFLVNCALWTEGIDLPNCSFVAMARPTKSLAVYMQALGRGTRPVPGLPDKTPGRDEAEARCAAIASSDKPDMIVLDFVGNAGRHEIVRAVDALAGDSNAEKSIAKGILERGETDDVLEALRRAKAQISEMEAKRLREQARRGYRVADVDTEASPGEAGVIFDPKPFDLLGFRVPDNSGPPCSWKQAELLEKLGISARGMSRGTASKLLTSLDYRRRRGFASYKQVRLLARHGRTTFAPEFLRKLQGKEASKLINELAANNWVAPRSWGLRFGRFRHQEQPAEAEA